MTNRRSSQPDNCCDKIDGAVEVDCSAVISGGEAAEALRPVEATLDAVAMFVSGFFVRDDDLARSV
jgi:hypothetical protein